MYERSTLAVVQRHHSVYSCPADGAFLWLWQGVIAPSTRTHVTTLQEHAGALSAQAHGAAGGRHAALVHVEFTNAFLLLLLEFLQHAPLLPTLLVMHVSLPQDVGEHGSGGDPGDESQNPPESHALRLLPQEGVVVQPGEEVREALLGRLELDEVVVQHQLAHPRDAVAHPQHLLGLVDALGPLPR